MRKHVLFSAFSCLPNRGSEPGVGWNWAVQAAKNPELQVSVLTREKCRKKIEPELAKLKMNNLDFIYVPSSAKLRQKSIYLEYIKWEYDSYRFVKKNFGPNDFDCVWFTTFGNVFLPIWVHKLPYKFIWGPMGGGEHVPRRFYESFSFKDSLTHRIKDLLVKTARFNPVVQGPAKRADLIFARTEETKALLRDPYKEKTILTLETRMDSSSLPASCFIAEQYDDGRLHICYTGRLIALKNVDSLVRAVVALLDKGYLLTLHLVGEGPLEPELRHAARDYVDAGYVVFHGQLQRDKALSIVASCPIFVFPSLREGGSWSLLEAMILGRAIVCFDASGMHEMVDENSAELLPMLGPGNVASQFEASIRRLADNPDYAAKLGAGAKHRALKDFCWDDVRMRVCRAIEEACS